MANDHSVSYAVPKRLSPVIFQASYRSSTSRSWMLPLAYHVVWPLLIKKSAARRIASDQFACAAED